MSGFNHITIRIPSAEGDHYDVTEQVPKFWKNDKLLYAEIISADGPTIHMIMSKFNIEDSILFIGNLETIMGKIHTVINIVEDRAIFAMEMV